MPRPRTGSTDWQPAPDRGGGRGEHAGCHSWSRCRGRDHRWRGRRGHIAGAARAEIGAGEHPPFGSRPLPPGHPGLVKATARVIAEAPDATLYGINDRGGNYCIELVGAHRGLVWSFSCELGLSADGRYVTPGAAGSDVSSIVVNGVEPPVVWWGRLTSGTSKARAVYPDGTREQIPLGRHGFFVNEPSEANQALARREPMTIEFLRSDGSVSLSTEVLPPQPLTVRGTFSGTISGHVQINSAAKIEIETRHSRKPQTSYLRIKSDGTFSVPWRRNTAMDPHVVDNNNKRLTDYLNPLPESAWRSLFTQAQSQH